MLNSIKCLCGKNLSQEQFTNVKPNQDRSFYGGRVRLIGEHVCTCGRELKGYYGIDANGYKLIDLEVCKDITEPKKIENAPTSNVIIEDEVPYVDYSYNELKKIAKEKGLTYSNSITKNELLNLLAH